MMINKSRLVFRACTGLGALVLAATLVASAAAQQTPVRVVQSSDGTLYVVQGSTSSTLVPDQASDSDVAALNPVAEIDGTFPNELFVTQAPAPVPVRVLQGSDGVLYTVQGSTSWTLVPDQISDSDLAALSPSGEVDGIVPAELPSLLVPPAAAPISPLPQIAPAAFAADISTIAGTGVTGFSGDGGPATAAQLNVPRSVAVGPDGSVYIADTENLRVRRVAPDGRISTFAGKGAAAFSGYSGAGQPLQSFAPAGIAVGQDGSIFIADASPGGHRVLKVAPSGAISVFAGTGVAGFSGDGGPATAAQLNLPYGVAVGPDGSVYIVDAQNDRIRRVAPNGTISTFAGTGKGGYVGDGGPATAANIQPLTVTVGPDGSVYIGDSPFIRRVAPDGTISTFAGNRAVSFGNNFSGDGGPAIKAQVDGDGMAVGPDGTAYIADTGNNRIRRVATDGTISTIAGTGEGGFSGDGGPALAARLTPLAIALGPDGSIYVTDTASERVRRLRSVGP